MRQIVVANGVEYGTYTSIEQTPEGYLCDGTMLPFAVVGQGEIREVADDYKTPAQIAAEQAAAVAAREKHNAEQKAKRKAAYTEEADPLFFMAQRGEATVEEWQAKIAEIKAKFPYQE